MEWKLKIEGMHCNGCAMGAAAALEGIKQVEKATVSFADGTALVVGDPRLDLEKLKKAVAKAGFQVSAVEVIQA